MRDSTDAKRENTAPSNAAIDGSVSDSRDLWRAVNERDVDKVRTLLRDGACNVNDTTASPLYRAAQRGDVEIVKLLMEHGALVNLKGKGGKTALSAAVSNGSLEIVTLLVDNGALVNDMIFLWGTPLSKASEQGNEEVVRYLLQQGACVTEKSGPATNPLFSAVRFGHAHIVKLLLEHGASIDDEIWGESPLFAATSRGHVSIVQLLIENGASVTGRNSRRETALVHAVRFNQTEAAAILCQHGAPLVNEKDESGNTLLHIAAQSCGSSMVRLLIANDACINETNDLGETPLSVASQRNNRDVMTVLIENGASVDTTSDSGTTALLCAAQFGQIDLVKKMVENGASVNERGEYGQSPLIRAARNPGTLEVVVYLLDNGADVSIKTELGQTALHAAAAGGYADIANVLLNAGISVNEMDVQGETALFVAADNGHIEMIELLIDNGASVNENSSSLGETPLSIAVVRGQAEMVRSLLSRGASVSGMPNMVRVEIESVVILAGREGYMDIFKILIEAGASVNARGYDGETPLIAAAGWDFVDGVQLIVAHGASLGGSDQSGGDYPVFPSTIHTLSELCATTFVFEQIFGRVVRRLEDVCVQLQGLQGCEKMNTQQSVLLSFAGIIFRICRLVLRICKLVFQCTERKSLASWLQNSLLNKIRDVHEEIDHFIKLYGLQPGNSDWGLQWEEDQVLIGAQCQQLLVSGDITGTQELDRSFNQVNIFKHDDGSEVADNDASAKEDSSVDNSSDGDGASQEDAKWFISPNDVSFYKWNNIDDGYPSTMYTGTWRSTRVTIATTSMKPREVEQAATRWDPLVHPHVLRLYGACHTASERFFVFEHIPRASKLQEFLSVDANRHLVWKKLYEVALGLQFLFERGVIHGNIDCENIVVGADGKARLAGLEKLYNPPPNGRNCGVCPRLVPDWSDWRSPELRKGEPRSFASDIFAFSACVLRAVWPHLLWNRWKLDRAADERLLSKLPSYQWDLVKRMRERDPAQRANIAFVVSRLKEFADGIESIDTSGETLEFTSSTVQVQSIGEYVSSELGNSIDKAIQFITMKCASIPETHWMREKVSPTVAYLYELIQERDMRENDDVVAQFCALLARIQGYLRTPISAASVARLARSQKVAESHYTLYADLDRLLDILDVSRSDPIRSWSQTKEEIERRVLGSGSELEVVTEEITASEAVSLVYFDEQVSQDFLSTGFSSSAETPFWYSALHEVVFTEGDRIGESSSGAVYKGSWMDTPVVVKFMGYEEDAGTVSTKRFLHEVRVWSQLNHPHIVKLYGASHVDKRYFVCEYAPNGDLLDYLKKRKHDNRSKYEMWQKLYEVALGLQHMHKLNIVHNDLKCDNILVGATGEAKLIDFGLSSLPNKAEIMVDSKNVGAVHWRSPEYLRGERPVIATDIYSFAMCILQAVTGDVPWGNMEPVVVRYRVKKGEIPMRPPTMNDKQWNLIELMTKAEASNRVKVSFVVDKLLEIAQEERRQ